MSNNFIEKKMEIPIEHCINIFGQYDIYMKKIESAFHIDILIEKVTL